MTKRIFRNIFIVAISVFLASVVLFMGVLYDYFSDVQQNQLKMQTELAARGVEDEGLEYLKNLDIKDYRITWIGTDGTVLYDSATDANSMENHFKREEIKEALAEGYGESARYSDTLTERYLYSAKRLPDGTVLRLSIAQNSLLTLTVGMLQPVCIIFIIAVVLSLILASRLSKKIVKPLNELNLDEPLSNDKYDELSPLLRRIDVQQRQIRKQGEELRQKQSEFEAVTGGMTEGIVLLNDKGSILSINRAAAKLFGAESSVLGKNIISVNRSLELTELINKSENAVYTEKVIKIKDGKYRISASPVVLNDKVSGIALLIMDVTDKEKNEQMRREFTANVSHELKTPLHTISGCAELLSNGMVKTEDVAEFSKQIYTQSQRMIQLIEDIISLSHLDEGTDDMKFEQVDLFTIAADTVKMLEAEAENLGITLEVKGKSVEIYGVVRLLSSIVYNLCDNAIKYNCSNGSVLVSIEDEDEFAVLSVSDTGIGIPEEYQERIFERFFRVDKSRSKEIGGTGLGLSIVKHAARLHGATITVNSTVNSGTDITIKFPKNKI